MAIMGPMIIPLVGTLFLLVFLVATLVMIRFPGRYPVRRWMDIVHRPLKLFWTPDDESPEEARSKDLQRGWMGLLGPFVVVGGGLLYWIVYQMIYGAQ